MKSLSLTAFVLCLAAVSARGVETSDVVLAARRGGAPMRNAEAPAVTVAIVRTDRVMNNHNFYEQVRLLSANKDVLEAIRRANADLEAAYQQVIKTEDAVQLAELENRMQFLKRKLNLLRQGVAERNRDIRMPFREFVVKTYGQKYPLILDDLAPLDRCWNRRIEIVDITDEAGEKFRRYINDLVGDDDSLPAPSGGMSLQGRLKTDRAAAAAKAVLERAAAEKKAADDKAAAAKAAAEQEAAAARADAVQKAAAEKAAAQRSGVGQ